MGLATDRTSFLSWPNVYIATNHRWTCRSIINIAIDLFTSEDRYFLWIVAVPLFTIPTTFVNAHAWCYTREAPLSQSATQVRSSLLDSSMLWLFREAITSPIIVFTSQSHLLRWYKLNCNRFKDRERLIFLQHRPPVTLCHFFLLRSGDCAMTLAFHVLQKIYRMEIFITIYFYIWT